jgi:dihydrofolate reductase
VFGHGDLPAIPGADLRFVSGDVRPVHAEMSAVAQERNIWIVGGGELVGQFHDAGLLDEMRVSIAPVALGAGTPLIPRRIEDMRVQSVEQDGQRVNLWYVVRGAES